MTAGSPELLCPLCGERSIEAFTTWDRNRRTSGERFHYRRCAGCDALFLANVPADLGPFYAADYYALPRDLEPAARADSYKLDFIRPHVASGRLVEVGAGPGAFAYAARTAGFDVTAIEMDARACAHLRTVAGVEAVQSDAPDAALAALPPSDVIAMWHVLEHLRDPWRCIEAAAANLAPGGLLVVAVPNPEALQFRVLKARWPHVDAPRHLFLIPAALLTTRCADAGLELLSLETADPGGRHWNAFGWAYAVVRPSAPPRAAVPAFLAGRAVAGLLAPIERRDLRGSTYTAVFRKPQPREPGETP